MEESELEIVRRAYAKQIMAAAGVADARVEAAFATVKREAFLGPGPWPALRWGRGYVPTPSADPVYLYTDDLFGIVPERGLNNGQPSLHAMLIASVAPQPGQHAVHVGAGVGYYTAILAELVGSTGIVTTIEFDQSLADRCESNFTEFENVRVVQGDGALVPFDSADVIYVNAGATHPADSWLDRLKDGGRLILPLTTDEGFQSRERGNITREPSEIRRRGAVFRIERRGTEYLARWISAVGIFPCEGGREEAPEKALAAALDRGGWFDARRVTRLYRRDDLPGDQCWLRAPGWCLAYY